MYIRVKQELPFALQAMLADKQQPSMYVFTDYAGLLKLGVCEH